MFRNSRGRGLFKIPEDQGGHPGRRLGGDEDDWGLGAEQQQPQRLPSSTDFIPPAGTPNKQALYQETHRLYRPSAMTVPSPPQENRSNQAAPPKKKPTKTNGYLLFVYHRKNQVEKETGKKITVPLPALMSMFDADYKSLSEDEKEKWKNRAKERNAQNGVGSESSDGDKAWAT